MVFTGNSVYTLEKQGKYKQEDFPMGSVVWIFSETAQWEYM